MTRLLLATACAVALLSPATRADDEWVKGVSYTTDWDEAIKMVRSTGKMLFIYNGWQREKI